MKTTFEEKSFKEFWLIYPKKVNKKEAYKSFMKFDLKHMEHIVHGAKFFTKTNKDINKKFLPCPSYWLDMEKWLEAFYLDDHGYIIDWKDIPN